MKTNNVLGLFNGRARGLTSYVGLLHGGVQDLPRDVHRQDIRESQEISTGNHLVLFFFHYIFMFIKFNGLDYVISVRKNVYAG